MTCMLCEEPILDDEPLAPVNLLRGPFAHQECALREVLGGIGHLIDHQHFCLVKHDPDAGLTYRESAKLVVLWVALKGTDAADQTYIEHDHH